MRGVSNPLKYITAGTMGTSSSDIWAVGQQGAIVHYDGKDWVAVASPTREGLFAVWGISSSDIWAVGGKGVVIRYDGSRWTKVTSAPASI